jgi:hypothetical protein
MSTIAVVAELFARKMVQRLFAVMELLQQEPKQIVPVVVTLVQQQRNVAMDRA